MSGKATALILALYGDAPDLLHTILECEQQSYSTLNERLEIWYNNHHLHVYQAPFKKKQKRPSETLQQYEKAPKYFLDYLMVQKFIDGIRDIKMQVALRLGNPSKLEEALRSALDLKLLKLASRSQLRVRKIRQYPSEKVASPFSAILTEKLFELIEVLKILMGS